MHIPIQIAKVMLDLSAASIKKLVTKPGAGHEDLREIGCEEFYESIVEFVKKI